MARSNSFNKREVEKRKQEKRLEKQKRKEERKANPGNASFEDMIAYVDENGVITDTPPDPANKSEVEIEDIAVSIPKKEDVKDPRLNGKIEYFNTDKGYGFIKDTDNMEKYFFHISNAPESIKEGDKVTFELERGQRGMNAVRVTLANKE